MPDDRQDAEPELWSAVRALVERSPSVSDLHSHGLHLIAARTWREQGRGVPQDLALQELIAIGQVHAAAGMLRRVASIVDQEIVALKGIAVAERYPAPALRPFGDLDLLVADPAGAQRRLIAAGFRPSSGFDGRFYEGHHHLEPLELPGRETMKVEIHSRAPWVHWCPAPSFDELRARAQPSGTPGVWFPDQTDHALILACHSWHERPLRRILDLIDIALVSGAVERATLAEQARRRQVDRLWTLTQAVGDALLRGADKPLPLHVWARDLPAVRECTVLERHLRQWLAPFAVRTPHAAASEAVHSLRLDLRPTGDEDWRQKLSRTRQGLAHPLRPIGVHDRDLGEAARRLRPREGRSSGIAGEPARRGDGVR